MNSTSVYTKTALLAVMLAATPLASAQSDMEQNGSAEQSAEQDSMSSQQGNQDTQGSMGGSQSQGSPSQQGGLAKTQMKVRKLQKELQTARKQAMANNPELEKKEQQLRDDVIARMEEEGVNPEQSRQRLQEIQKKRRSQDLSAEKKQALSKEFREKMQAIREAQRTAMQDDEISTQQDAFREDLIAAMKSEDEDVEQTLEEYKRAQQKLRQQMQNRTGMGQGGG